MNCKICGAPIIGSSPNLGSFVIGPTCRCGKIRKREREKGCPQPQCDAKGKDIILEAYAINMYFFICKKCHYQWKVEE
jgi:hypothetical protein